MMRSKEFLAALIVCLAALWIAGLSISKASADGYLYNLFTGSRDHRSASWDVAVWKKAKLTNTIEIPIEQAENLTIWYSSKNIHVYPAQGDKIIVEEYLRNHGEKDKAKVTYKGNNQTVIEGADLTVRHFYFLSIGQGVEHIDVYVPEQGMKELKIETSSGNITADSFREFNCENLSLHATSGNIRWEDMKAEEILADTSSGNIRMEDIAGYAEIKASSGNISMCGFEGCGKMNTSSGNIAAEMEQVTGSIEMKASSGNVSLEIPDDVSFNFEADTSSGNIRTDFDDALSYNKKGNSADGNVGTNPKWEITMKATSGNVRVVYR